jgi:GDP-L-fucose synthase
VQEKRPDAIVIAAAKVGGILANRDNPVGFLTENLQIQTNLLDAANEAGIPRVLFLGSSCIYPKLAPQPIREEFLMTGELEPTNESFAIAKLSGLKLVRAYRKQYDRNWISAMPTNIYGPGDDFDPTSAHVLSSLIHKFYTAKMNKDSRIVLWGTGTPKREFLHSDDLAKACLFLLDNYNEDLALNVGTGTDVAISELADIIKNIVGYDGEIFWDTSKPDGAPRKLLDISKIEALGWKPSIKLEEGIVSTIDWYIRNHSAAR